jgi:hypothetical protein
VLYLCYFNEFWQQDHLIDQAAEILLPALKAIVKTKPLQRLELHIRGAMSRIPPRVLSGFALCTLRSLKLMLDDVLFYVWGKETLVKEARDIILPAIAAIVKTIRPQTMEIRASTDIIPGRALPPTTFGLIGAAVNTLLGRESKACQWSGGAEYNYIWDAGGRGQLSCKKTERGDQ